MMTSPELLPRVEVEPAGPARAAVIWLHGLGADGHDFEPIVPYLGIDPARGVRFVFPHAPRRAVTINMGMIMPAWYDIRGAEFQRDEDEAGILQSAEQVRALIEREVARGIPRERIVMAGFSQGGAVALHVALREPERLAGVMALSTYLVLEDSLQREASEVNRDVPIFQAHGSADPLVALERGERARARLTELGYAIEWHTYPMGHEVCPDEIRDIGAWLGRVLPQP
jgi:phospholipase/carboxylesterase